MKKEMLINVLQPEECRIAIVEDGVLEELYLERTSHESYTGNIYKGKIVNLEPAIQAAFVDFSVGRNGFLHVSDVEPQYYRRHLGEDAELGARDRGRDPRQESRPTRPDVRPPRGPSQLPPPPPSALDDSRDWDRDRPDRSEKGRRDRSTRRFGEGLTDDLSEPAPPPPPPSRPIESPPAESPARFEREEPRPAAPEDTPPARWPSRRSGPGWGAREVPPSEPPVEPRGRTAPPIDPIEASLPPSRTQRGRTNPPARTHEFGEIEESTRARTAPPSREVEPEAEFPPIEPRRGRASRAPRPARPVEPTLPDFEPLASEAPTEPLIEDRPDVPRRRGRDAIRSRGGDREPMRPREIPPPPERRGSLPPERPVTSYAEDAAIGPEPVEPVREAAPPERPRRRSRGERPRRPADAEAPRDRTRPHGRAGEPGYVPRRERIRGTEPGLEEEATTAPLDWEDLEARAADLGGGLEDTESATEILGEDSAISKEDLGKRRRRRRGRRRDRPEREPAALPRAAGEPDEDEGPAPEGVEFVSRQEVDEFDFDDDAEVLEDEDEASGLIHEHRAVPVNPEEEIDPELEEEIRREIEEIAELEREMGLRGPVEARPRRGDERDVESRAGGRPARGRGMVKPPIQEIFRRGDEVLVQVIKESIGTKGPTLSTYISIPGRYLVLMPGLNRVGVSRKIADEAQRRKLREIMNELNPPKGLGFIVRTAGLERTKRELARDLAYLLRLWKVILRRIKKAKAPAPIYQESDMITRTIRDIFTSEIDTIWIDEPQAFERAQEFLRVVMPRFVNRLKFYDEKVPLFHKYGIEDEIAKIQRRHVPLPEGGSIVIDQTEALVAIDVNSGNFRVESDAERTAYEMNLRAAKEIARQLRLRDLGGVIVNDFIDMRDERNRRGVERALRDAIKRDRARTKVLRMSQFGIIEMTRQRIRPSLKRSVYEDCSHCAGAGVVKTAESMAIDVMRILALASHREDIRRVNLSVAGPVASYLNNRKRREIARLESEANMSIHIRHENESPAEFLQIDCFDAQNNEVRLLPAPPPPSRRGR